MVVGLTLAYQSLEEGEVVEVALPYHLLEVVVVEAGPLEPSGKCVGQVEEGGLQWEHVL